MPKIELKSILKKHGVVGAGGAGFPSYAKLTDGADLLVINCIALRAEAVNMAIWNDAL